MASMTFLINDSSTGGNVPIVQITITENEDGTVTFSVTQLVASGNYLGDLRGLFFDVANEELVTGLNTLTATSTMAGLTEIRFGDDTVKDLGDGANMQGLLGGDSGYDVGIEIGTSGIGKDDIGTFSFTLDSSLRALTLADFSNVAFGARLTSVGRDTNGDGVIDTARNGSAKIGEVTFSVISPRDERVDMFEDQVAPPPVGTTGGNLLANDGAGVGDTLSITNWTDGVTSLLAETTFVSSELAGASVTINSDGTWSVDANAADSLAEGESVSQTFTYTVLQSNIDGSSTQTATFTITITGTNDAPVLTVDSTGGVTEDAASPNLTDSGTLSFTDADVNDTHVTSAIYNTDAVWSGGLLNAGQVTAITSGFTVDGDSWDYSVANSALQFLGAGESITLSFAVTVTDDSGAVNDSDTETVTLTLTGTNDAPVLNSAATPAGNAVLEDAGAPIGAVGTLVSQLVNLNPPSGGLDNVTDADNGAVTGIAITAADATNGTWLYSTDGGTSWSALGTPTTAAARLLAADADNRLYFQPNADYDGQADITFRAWDTTTGTDGGIANTTPNGGTTAFSTATDTATFDVTPVNDEPTATNLSAAETYTEDTALNLTNIVVSDVDSANVTATLTLSNTAAGSLSTGTSGAVTSTYVAGTGMWTASGAIADVNALLAGVTFNPALNFNSSFSIATSVSDGVAAAITGSKAITGTPANDAPIATSDILYVSNSTVITLPTSVLLANDIDIDGAALSVTAISLVSGTLASAVTINPNGTFSFTTAATGGTVASPTVVTLSYTLSDGATGTTTGSITLNVLDTTSGANTIDLTGIANYQGSYIDGKAGGDTLSDGAFQSVLLGSNGNDTLNGNAGSDLLVGGDNNDALNGGAGNDVLRGGQNNDAIDGGAGSEDMIDFSDATAGTGITLTLVQSSSDTTFNTPAGTGLGNDTYKNIEGVIGTSSADTITGSASNDIIRGGGGNDTLNGAGNTVGGTDLIDFSDGTAGLTFTLVNNGAGTVFNASAAGLGTDTYSGFEGVIGTAFADTLTGSASADQLRGGGGNDVISGLGGDDRIVGGLGADTMTGGTGSDTFVFDTAPNAVDSVTDFNASGTVGSSDFIELSKAIFTLATPSGSTLLAADFASSNGGGATDSVGAAHVIYDSATGNLYYDSDGGSSANRTLVATLTTIPVDPFDFNDIKVGP